MNERVDFARGEDEICKSRVSAEGDSVGFAKGESVVLELT